MEAARILILGVALAAGGAAAFFIGPGEEKKPQTPRAVQLETADVLIAQANIGPLSLALRRLCDASKIGEENPTAARYLHRSHWCWQQTNDAS